MVGSLKRTFDEVAQLTLKELVLLYDAYLIDSWNHTSVVACQIHNLTITLINVNSKSPNARPKNPSDFHPFLKKSDNRNGIKITSDTISDLEAMAEFLC